LFARSIFLGEWSSVGIVSNSVEWWLGQSRPTLDTAPERYQLAQKYQITNHDSGYNILFTDGAVKTFNDGARSLFREMVDIWVDLMNANYGTYTGTSIPLSGTTGRLFPYTDVYIFTPYFDTAYQQD